MDPLESSLTIKLMSLVVHIEEYMETRNPFDVGAISGLLTDPEIVAKRKELEAMGLLPEKR